MPNKKNPLSSYYNYPKLYGEAPPEERWHSDESEPGMIPPWMKGQKINDPSTWSGEGENIYGQKYGTRKDQFGFGTEQPISAEDILKMGRVKLDKMYSLGELDQDEYKRLYGVVQDKIKEQQKVYTSKALNRDIGNELQDPRFWSNIKGMITGKSKEERIDEHKNLDSSKFKTVYGDEGYSPFIYKHSNIPYYNFRTGKKEIMEL